MIRVIIERNVKEGCFHDYLDMIRRARKQATAIEGFIAGELLQEKSNQHKAFIISSWENNAAWEKWYNSEERQEVLEEMRPLLTTDEKITVLENSQLLK
ncbi:antibiotic biosynthesis monooxygenase family protein [Aliikangiella sp. IMCC44359]|uniref:antibiotic biosynthesis monooxygenase family protein n=1 Tax=Aliikangiella sp. IMCC44359 TaxID=3459125 RepID=UPI00403B35A9